MHHRHMIINHCPFQSRIFLVIRGRKKLCDVPNGEEGKRSREGKARYADAVSLVDDVDIIADVLLNFPQIAIHASIDKIIDLNSKTNTTQVKNWKYTTWEY